MYKLSLVPKASDLSHAQASVQAASSRAGAYLSSWGTWASEKRKVGWGRSSNPATPLDSPPPKPPRDIKQSAPFSLPSNEKPTSAPSAAEVREPAASPSHED